MGQEISDSQFDAADFSEFERRLERETALLGRWIKYGRLRSPQLVGGFELEAWLTDRRGNPAPINELLLGGLHSDLVVPELARFNVELNSPPAILASGALDAMYTQLQALWQACEHEARQHRARVLMIGILPTVRQSDLTLANMSNLRRYRAINDQVFRLRDGRPIELCIDGVERLQMEHHDVMLESATTSFQIHLQVDIAHAVRAFNASKILSAPMLALSANSPYLFGKDLWAETRIPLFEQAVAVGGTDYSKRVTFGVRYADQSIMECFEANRLWYPVLLPHLMDEPEERLAHLRMHNGTIWRWNRPLIGFDDAGTPHLRIEHRVVPSGPTPLDTIANAAFYFGMMAAMLSAKSEPQDLLTFAEAQANFYAAARYGLSANVRWDGKSMVLRRLVGDVLLPMARRGLDQLGLGQEEAGRWLEVLRARLAGPGNAAQWQRNWVAAHGRRFEDLVCAYYHAQQSERSLHEWEI